MIGPSPMAVAPDQVLPLKVRSAPELNNAQKVEDGQEIRRSPPALPGSVSTGNPHEDPLNVMT